MLSSENIKFIRSLLLRKYREKNKLFIIEGDKLVSEFLASTNPVKLLLARPAWLENAGDDLLAAAEEIISVNDRELRKVSSLKTPQNTLALVAIEKKEPAVSSLAGSLNIALDNIRDPGNLGTIIRIAAWFGIKNIICSHGTVDVYNPKTVQSSMGALIHVDITYTDLPELIAEIGKRGTPVYATTLDGEPVQNIKKSDRGLLLFGNESRGLSDEIMSQVTHRLIIPPYNVVRPGIDSLNVAMSAAIICNEFRREK